MDQDDEFDHILGGTGLDKPLEGSRGELCTRKDSCLDFSFFSLHAQHLLNGGSYFFAIPSSGGVLNGGGYLRVYLNNGVNMVGTVQVVGDLGP